MLKNILLLSAAGYIGGCTVHNANENGTAAMTEADAMAANLDAGSNLIDVIDDKPSRKDKWTYKVHTDEMRGSVDRLAAISSNNKLQLDSPYGEMTPELVLRQTKQYGFNIIVSSAGQPQCRNYNNDTVSVKFDNGPITKWRCGEAASGSSGMIFLRSEKAFLAKLKSSKMVTLEILYYDAGRQQMTFPVAGLQWP